MSRVFNIAFQHAGVDYTALISVAGNESPDHEIRVNLGNDTIQIFLPSGRLILSIPDVLQRLLAAPGKEVHNASMNITRNISLQLLNTSW
jgi:hypothetical protein